MKKSASMIEGSDDEQCAMLWDYCEELKRTNLGSTVVMKIAPVGDVSGLFRFKRIYICFEALKKGFSEYCRLVIGLDGCHLTDSTKVWYTTDNCWQRWKQSDVSSCLCCSRSRESQNLEMVCEKVEAGPVYGMVGQSYLTGRRD
eukprot:TRINITY_DN7161_c0_g1_i5.p5 TRINITY_DN7161_c0_g1~~TRINITY_DN7161_c0_g1_i5.p5  ORF type:complete len:144 (+),score=26.02 TRINITY_DN7161_c0_g1_i5:1834-2265(+)